MINDNASKSAIGQRILLTRYTSLVLRDAVLALESGNWDLWDKVKWDLSDAEYRRCLEAYDVLWWPVARSEGES